MMSNRPPPSSTRAAEGRPARTSFERPREKPAGSVAALSGQRSPLVVTPIAGYLSAIRSVVASPLQTVRIRVVDAHEALLSIDGYDDIPLNVGDVVEVSAQEAPIRFVEPKSAMPFWDLLRHKVELLPS